MEREGVENKIFRGFFWILQDRFAIPTLPVVIGILEVANTNS